MKLVGVAILGSGVVALIAAAFLLLRSLHGVAGDTGMYAAVAGTVFDTAAAYVPTPQSPRIAWHYRLIAAVEAQKRDPAWATIAEAVIAAELGKSFASPSGRAAGRAIKRIDCRSNSCLILAEWASYDAARSSWAELLGAPLTVQCNREFALADPQYLNAPYRAQMVLTDCG